MLKKIAQRATIGFSATVIIHLAIAFFLVQAGISPVTPEFAAHFTNEVAAVIVQTVLSSLIGVAFACGSLVFEIERWSFLLQGAVHFGLTAAVWVPIASNCWRPTSVSIAFRAALGWLATYLVTWFAQYMIYRSGIKKLNADIASFGAEVNESE